MLSTLAFGSYNVFNCFKRRLRNKLYKYKFAFCFAAPRERRTMKVPSEREDYFLTSTTLL